MRLRPRAERPIQTPPPTGRSDPRRPTLSVANLAINCAERGIFPDAFVRTGIRHLLASRLAEICTGSAERAAERTEAFVSTMRTAAIASLQHKANEQHYEVPAEFFGHVLG